MPALINRLELELSTLSTHFYHKTRIHGSATARCGDFADSTSKEMKNKSWQVSEAIEIKT